MIKLGKAMAVWLKTQGFCWYCGSPLSHTDCHIDHVVPRADGGGNDLENLVPCCKTCNAAKGARSIEGYRKLILRKALFQKQGVILSSNDAYDAFVRFCEAHAPQFALPRHEFYFERSKV